jgi:tetratricopeptide (TPR) repeat protein
MKRILLIICALVISFRGYNQTTKVIDLVLDKIDVSDTSQLRHTMQILRQCQKIKYTKGEARCLHKLGYIYFNKESYSQALEKYLQSIKLREKTGESEYKAMLLINCAYVFHAIGNFDKEIEYSSKALKVAKSDSLISYANLCMGRAYVEKGLVKEGLSFLRHGIALKLRTSEVGTVWENFIELGNAFVSIERYDTAFYYYSQVKKYNSLNQHALAKMYNGMGYCSFLKGKYEEAERYYLMGASFDDRNELGRIYLNLSELYFKENEKDKAYRFADLAMKYPHSASHLAKTLFLIGDYKRASEVFAKLNLDQIKDHEQKLLFEKEVVETEYKVYYDDQLELNRLQLESEKEKRSYQYFSIFSMFVICFAIGVKYYLKVKSAEKFKKEMLTLLKVERD